MKSEIVPYKPLHAYEIFDRQIRETEFFLTSVGNWEEAAQKWETAGPAFTYLINGAPYGCGGVAMLDATFGECWVLLPKSDCSIIVGRAIMKKFQDIIDNRKFRRLQAFIVEGFEIGIKLAERLGFTEEGLLKKYGPNGENIHLYARTF